MNEEHIKDILKKYESGTSSLAEEKKLFDTVDESNSRMKMWADFAKNNKKEAPDDLNDRLWASFEKKTNKTNRKFKIGWISIAASIALLVTFYMSNLSQNKLSIQEKETLLNEAKSMFVAVNENQEMYNVILENEMVVVYTKTIIK